MGHQPKTAQDIMSRRVHALSPTATVVDAAHELLRLGYSGAPVTEPDGRLVGVFSEQDSLRVLTHAAYEGWPGGTVADHMTREVAAVAPGDDLATVSGRFAQTGHRRVLVVADGRVVGVIARRDLVRALYRMLAPERPQTVYEIFSKQR